MSEIEKTRALAHVAKRKKWGMVCARSRVHRSHQPDSRMYMRLRGRRAYFLASHWCMVLKGDSYFIARDDREGDTYHGANHALPLAITRLSLPLSCPPPCVRAARIYRFRARAHTMLCYKRIFNQWSIRSLPRINDRQHTVTMIARRAALGLWLYHKYYFYFEGASFIYASFSDALALSLISLWHSPSSSLSTILLFSFFYQSPFGGSSALSSDVTHDARDELLVFSVREVAFRKKRTFVREIQIVKILHILDSVFSWIALIFI